MTARQLISASESIKEANAKHHAHLAALRQARTSPRAVVLKTLAEVRNGQGNLLIRRDFVARDRRFAADPVSITGFGAFA